MRKRYWICIVGPTDQDALSSGSDAPMRKAVMDAFDATTGHYAYVCFSGWGLTRERMEEVRKAWAYGTPDDDEPYEWHGAD